MPFFGKKKDCLIAGSCKNVSSSLYKFSNHCIAYIMTKLVTMQRPR